MLHVHILGDIVNNSVHDTVAVVLPAKEIVAFWLPADVNPSLAVIIAVVADQDVPL